MSSIRSTVSLLFVIAYTAVASMVPFFHYDGDAKEFDEINQEHKGTVNYVRDEAYSFPSDKALAFSQTYDPNYEGRYHSEASLYNAYKPGQKGYYGFAFKLPSDWHFSDDTMTIVQFITDFTDWEEDGLKGKGWSPSTKVWIKGNQLFARTRSGKVLKEDFQHIYIADISKNNWHTVVLGVDWSDTADGNFRVWYDGKLAAVKKHVATTMKADDRPYTMRVGLYATDWHNHHDMAGSQRTKTIYIDKISMGSTYEEAAPEIWACCKECGDCRRKQKAMEAKEED